jgi:cytochrome c553
MKRVVLATVLAALALPLAAAESQRQELQRVLRATPDAEQGRELFLQCVSCHGSDGAGQENGNTPRIAGQHYEVLAKQLVDFRHGKRWDFRMESFADKHHLETAQDVANVAAYVHALDPGEVAGTGDGLHATDGALLFGAKCASCHGPLGRGNARERVPQLAGQHYGYIMRQMYDAVDGRRPTMDRVHSGKIEPLDFEQVRAVADFLARVPWSAEAKPAR